MYMNRLLASGAPHQEVRSAKDDVLLTSWHPRLITAYPNKSIGRFFSPGCRLHSANFDFIVERYRHHDCVKKVVAILPFADDAQTQIDLRWRSNLHAPLVNIA